MADYPSQSHKTHEPREVVPVTRNPGRIRKAPWGRRLRETVIQGDAESAWTSMIWNSFLPGLADQIESAMHEGLSTLFGGGTSVYRRERRQGGSRISRHSPDRVLGGGRPEERISRNDRTRQDVSVIEIDSRAEAETVLERLLDSIDQFDVVTLAEFYQLVQITPDHTDFGFGWDDLGGSKIVHSKGVYFLDLPTPFKLK